jgi:hypothetical protein
MGLNSGIYRKEVDDFLAFLDSYDKAASLNREIQSHGRY